VSGYILEGHVPASAVRRLLTERPKALGLAVPGAHRIAGNVLFGPAGRTTFMRFVGKEAIG
jgi:hypothetical protein